MICSRWLGESFGSRKKNPLWTDRKSPVICRPAHSVPVFITSSFHTNGSGGCFKCGDIITHVRYGRGRILGEWGAFRDTDPIDGRRIDVNGADIFEVRFEDGEARSVCGSSLTLVESTPFHPFAQKFPKLSSADYEALKASIRKNGLFEPIVVNASGQILDGRHRHRACQELGITPKTISFETIKNAAPNQSLSEERYVYDSNIERRHLTPSQKAALALEFLPALRKEAAARQNAARLKGLQTQNERRSKGKVQQVNDNWAPTSATGSSRTERQTDRILAKRAGVGLPTMKAVIAINDHAPELLPELVNGSLSAAEAIKTVATGKMLKSGKAPKGEMNGDAPFFEKKTILSQWKKTWAAFINQYPSSNRKEVRQIVMAHLSRL
jgi:hypothetical protein